MTTIFGSTMTIARFFLFLPLFFFLRLAHGHNPSNWMPNPLGQLPLSLFAHRRCQQHAQLSSMLQGRWRGKPRLFHTNSLLGRCVRPSTTRSFLPSRSFLIPTPLTRRYLLDFFNPLEPLELAWELYCNRYEILDELVVKIWAATRRHSFQFLAVTGGALLVGEVMARAGLFGKKRGLFQTCLAKSNQYLREGTEERLFQKASSWMVDNGLIALQHFHGLGSKSKFAISISAGALFGRAMIASTVLCVKALLVSFFFIETLSFLGVIGEAGESILDWVEDEYERHASWTMILASLHKKARRKMSLAWLEELYEAAVDEEKIASFGFSVGTVFTLLT